MPPCHHRHGQDRGGEESAGAMGRLWQARQEPPRENRKVLNIHGVTDNRDYDLSTVPPGI